MYQSSREGLRLGQCSFLRLYAGAYSTTRASCDPNPAKGPSVGEFRGAENSDIRGKVVKRKRGKTKEQRKTNKRKEDKCTPEPGNNTITRH